MILSFNETKGGAGVSAPVMGGAGTSTASNITSSGVYLSGTYTGNGGSAISATGFVVYPNGNASTIIGGANVMQYVDSSLASPVAVSITNLAPTTNYCAKPYATNAIGTSYGDEVCFTTSPIGYATNLSSNDISIVDLTTFSQTGTISGISNPLSGFIDKGYMYVGGGNNFVTRIYLGDNTSISLNLGAQTVIIGYDNTHIYVGTGSNGTLHKIDKSTFAVDTTMSGLSDIQGGIIVGGFLYVNLQSSGAIHKIDLSTFTNVGSITPSFSGAHRITSDGTNLYVTYYISNAVVKIDIATFSVVSNLTGFSTPYGIVYDSVTNALYVANNGSGTVTKIDVSTFSSVGNVSVGSGPRYPLAKSGFLYVPCDAVDKLYKVDLSTFANVANTNVGDFPCQFMIQE